MEAGKANGRQSRACPLEQALQIPAPAAEPQPLSLTHQHHFSSLVLAGFF